MNSQKKLKLMISSLKDKELVSFFETYINCFSSQFSKSIRQISFNCFESVCQFRSKVVNGYGKNSSQAFINGVRNLIDLLLEDQKNQQVMKEVLRKTHSKFDSQKKLLATEKAFKNIGEIKHTEKSALAMSTNFNYGKPHEKQKSIKQQIFQYLNLQNLKISNPNVSGTIKTHENYMRKSVQNEEQQQLRITLKRIKQVQKQIAEANSQNKVLINITKKLREKLNYYCVKDKQNRISDISDKAKPSFHSTIQQNGIVEYSAKMNNYMNYASTNPNNQAHQVKIRSISVDPGQKYYTPYSNPKLKTQEDDQNSKKIKIPKLNLQALPNYHGKSNKSLNQSLMQVYEKSKK